MWSQATFNSFAKRPHGFDKDSQGCCRHGLHSSTQRLSKVSNLNLSTTYFVINCGTVLSNFVVSSTSPYNFGQSRAKRLMTAYFPSTQTDFAHGSTLGTYSIFVGHAPGWLEFNEWVTYAGADTILALRAWRVNEILLRHLDSDLKIFARTTARDTTELPDPLAVEDQSNYLSWLIDEL